MSLRVAFQMDPIQEVNIDADSTFRLAEEAQARGHSLFFYTPDKLAFQNGKITARGHTMTVQRIKGDHVALGAEEEVDLADWDVVWLRQDPPFDMGYITTTHLLGNTLHRSTRLECIDYRLVIILPRGAIPSHSYELGMTTRLMKPLENFRVKTPGVFLISRRIEFWLIAMNHEEGLIIGQVIWVICGFPHAICLRGLCSRGTDKILTTEHLFHSGCLHRK